MKFPEMLRTYLKRDNRRLYKKWGNELQWKLVHAFEHATFVILSFMSNSKWSSRMQFQQVFCKLVTSQSSSLYQDECASLAPAWWLTILLQVVNRLDASWLPRLFVHNLDASCPNNCMLCWVRWLIRKAEQEILRVYCRTFVRVWPQYL